MEAVRGWVWIFSEIAHFFGHFCQGNLTLQWGQKCRYLYINISKTGTSPPPNNAEV